MNKIIEMLGKDLIADLTKSLSVTWKGMLAIFIVMALISVIVFLFAKFSSIKK